jgi:SRSO17 transposase
MQSQMNLRLTQLPKMQAQRYFVERSFHACKSDIGRSKYQVRGWKAWHHHMAICMMAQAYVLNEKIEHQKDMPLLSAYNIRQVIMQTYIRKDEGYDEV